MTTTTTPVSTHRKIIIAIHANWATGQAFALRDVAKEAKVSTASVVRALVTLRKLNFVLHTEKACAGRYYRVTTRWPVEIKDAFEGFEYARLLKL